MIKNLGGRPTDYKEEYCELAIELLSSEHSVGIAELAAELNTTERTIQRWRKAHSEFAEAVHVGLTKGKVQLLKEARKSTIGSRDFNYNTPLFSRLMTSVYRDTEHGTILIDGWNEAETFEAKLKLVLDAVGNGEITTEHANKIADLLTKQVQIAEVTALKARIDALEGAK